MRTLIACVFMYSLDGLMPDQGTDYADFCFSLPFDPVDLAEQIDLYRGAEVHLMGRSAYEGMSKALPGGDHPFSEFMDDARKVVFSRTMRTADWVNTTIAAGDSTEEIDRLRTGGDGNIIVWGGVTLWRSLIELDLIDEFRIHLYPYITGVGTRLFDGNPQSYRLELIDSTAFDHGRVRLKYRRRR